MKNPKKKKTTTRSDQAAAMLANSIAGLMALDPAIQSVQIGRTVIPRPKAKKQ